MDFNGSLTSDLKKLRDLLSVHNLCNVVDFPTRVTETTSTCLDHVYVSCDIAENTRSAAVRCNLSDHFGVRVVVPCAGGPPPMCTRFARSYGQANRANFILAIESVDWLEIENRTARASPNDLATAILNVIKNKIEICFPLKRMQTTAKKIYWATDEIFNLNSLLIDMRDIAIKFPTNSQLYSKIDELQIKYDNLIQRERSDYYCNLIQESPNIIKSMWEVVRTETGRSKKFLEYTDILTRSDGSKYSNKTEVVNDVNLHFVSAASSCGAPAANVAAATDLLAAARPPADRSLRLKPFTPLEVFRIITYGVARKKSKDAYNVSVTLLHSIVGTMSYILSSLYNRCINEGTYPPALKYVKVSPLYKGKGRQEEINSYRPVSIIPAVAKIFEHGLSSRLVDYLSASEALSERQYAYRRSRSTTSLARVLLRKILDARGSQQQVAVIFCDLSKAFDVADHNVLTAKLGYYGVECNALRLLSEFMTGRCQVVVGEGGTVISNPLTTVIGVAQGSSLSNIMFSLLLNDLPENIRDGHVLMYADDVAAIVTAPTMAELERKLNRVAADLNHWFDINGLILNISKTHFIQFDLSGHKSRALEVLIGNDRMVQLKTTTFLGFQMDSALTWEGQVDRVCQKVGRACFALWRLSAILTQSMVRSCYYALVHSILQYGVEFWARSVDWERAFRMQKRAVRAIARVPEDASAQPLFRAMRILTLPSMVIMEAALYARDHLHEYSCLGDKRAQPSRRGHILRMPTCRLVKESKQVHVMASSVYNGLPNDIKNAPTRHCFKIKTRNFLVERAFYKVEDFYVKEH